MIVIIIACKPITAMGGVSSFLKTERNNMCVANVSNSNHGGLACPGAKPPDTKLKKRWSSVPPKFQKYT